MNPDTPLRGRCSCGRNKYTIIIPHDTDETAQVFFDNGHHHRRSQATPLSAFLRIPLTWYQSTTESFLPDESHSSIRRTYTSPTEQSSKRHFCGFCGTPLAYWTESPPEEAEFICLTLGSLGSDELRNLEDLGVLPREAVEDAVGESDLIERHSRSHQDTNKTDLDGDEGLPWFQTLVEGSRLGGMRRSLGSRRSRDGKVRVEWEIVEWTEGDLEDSSQSAGKRKLDALGDEDEKMGNH